MKWRWLLVIAGCSGSSTAPKPTPPNARRDDVSDSTPGAPLDGRLRIQPPPMCGGAGPPPNYRPPQLAPAPGISLRVMPGDMYSEQVATTVVTDTQGTFSATVPTGVYCLARDHGAKPTQAPSPYYELDCLVKRWQSCDGVITVPVTKLVEIDVHEPCEWSICYHGPPPP